MVTLSHIHAMDRGAWQAMVHRVAKSWTRLRRLSMHANGWCIIMVQLAQAQILALHQP